MTDAQWTKRYLQPLVGCQVVSVGTTGDGDGNWPTIAFQALDSGEIFTCEISRDPEGNGPGFIFGLPDPVRED